MRLEIIVNARGGNVDVRFKVIVGNQSGILILRKSRVWGKATYEKVERVE